MRRSIWSPVVWSPLCLMLSAGVGDARDKGAGETYALKQGGVETTALGQAADPAALAPVEDDGDFLQGAAAVDRLASWPEQNAKLFGVFGGDPAMNGLHTYICFLVDPDEGWRLFEVGDFLDFEVLSASRGRIELEITESRYDQATGLIGHGTRRLILTFDAPTEPDWKAPTVVTMTVVQ